MHRHLRLRSTKDFQRVRQKGDGYQHAYFVLLVTTNDLPVNRYGFVTGKRLGNAVVRNRVKRLLRENLRLMHDQLEQGYDIVVIARKPAVGKSLIELQEALHKLLGQSGLLRGFAE